MNRRLAFAAVLFALSALTLPPLAIDRVNEGVYRIDLEKIDELLLFQESPLVDVLVVAEADAEAVSDVHVAVVRDWVHAGGVLWAEGEGLHSSLVRSIVPVEAARFKFKKGSTGEEGGELIVRGALPTHVIHDHALTEGVERLYLYPNQEFSRTPKVEPLVTMTSNDGVRGAVIAAVPAGRGYVVLDGTAREERWLFGRVRGFSASHPNAVRLGDRWNSYDWDRLLESVREVASNRRGGSEPEDRWAE